MESPSKGKDFFPQCALKATEKHFGRDKESAAEEDENNEGTGPKAKAETEGHIFFSEFRVFLLLLNQYFVCCKVRRGSKSNFRKPRKNSRPGRTSRSMQRPR